MNNLEKTLRDEAVCRGCGGPKSINLVLCWTCFKYREDVIPLKEYSGTIAEWLAYVKDAVQT